MKKLEQDQLGQMLPMVVINYNGPQVQLCFVISQQLLVVKTFNA